MKFAILTLFASLVIANGFQYHIQVFLGDNYFEPLNGSLKLYVHRSSWQKDFLKLNETLLAPGRSYLSSHHLQQNIQEINNASFYYTLSSPYPPKYLFSKPSIYLKGIKIIPSYIQEPRFREQEARRFCPRPMPIKIKHKEEIKLYRC